MSINSTHEGTRVYDSHHSARAYEEMCFLVEKYVPSSKNQQTIGDRKDTTPELPASEEGSLAIPGATGEIRSPIPEAETVASAGSTEESKPPDLESEPVPLAEITERLENSSLVISVGDTGLGLSSPKLTSDKSVIGKSGLEPDARNTGETRSVLATGTEGAEAEAVPARIEQTYQPPGSFH